LRALFLKPAQAIAEALVLGDHRPDLFEHVDERILVPQDDRRQHAHVFARRRLIGANRAQLGKHALHLGAEKLEGNALRHRPKLVAPASLVNRHALSLNNSRPINIRRISLVPAPIS
jgi:hypothetical protein